jgi:hypothetical protein
VVKNAAGFVPENDCAGEEQQCYSNVNVVVKLSFSVQGKEFIDS